MSTMAMTATSLVATSSTMSSSTRAATAATTSSSSVAPRPSSSSSSLLSSSSLPRLLIDLEQVCGYLPTTMKEYDDLKEQIRSAFYESSTTTTASIPETATATATTTRTTATSGHDDANSSFPSSTFSASSSASALTVIASSNPQQPDDDHRDNPTTAASATSHEPTLSSSSEAATASSSSSISSSSLIVLAPRFDQRAAELLDAGMAFHIHSNTTLVRSEEDDVNGNSTTTNTNTNTDSRRTNNNTRWITMDYPDYLGQPDAGSNNNNTTTTTTNNTTTPISLLPTARVWNTILQFPLTLPSPLSHVPLFHTLFHHLQHCHRNLLWKHDMGPALLELIHDEYYHYKLTMEYDEWCRVGRSQQLSRLYQVRETIHQRQAMLQQQVQVLRHVREEHVQQQQYQQQQYQQQHGVGSAAVEFASLLFVGDDQQCRDMELEWRRCDDDNDNEEEEAEEEQVTAVVETTSAAVVEDDDEGDDEVDDEHHHLVDIGHDEDDEQELIPDTGILDNNDQTNPNELRRIDATVDDLTLGNANVKAAADDDEQQHSTTSPSTSPKKAPPKDERTRFMERLMEQYTTPELRRLEAMEQSLYKKLQEVDDLLESLQDEEWAAEEEQEHEDNEDDDYDDDDDDNYDENDKGGFDMFHRSLQHDRRRLTAETPPSPSPPAKDADQSDEEEGFTLLDQILAMILGRLDPIDHAVVNEGPGRTHHHHQPTRTRLEHLQWVQQEHKRIVMEWKNFFGRLPPPPSTTTSSSSTTAATTTTTLPTNKDESSSLATPSTTNVSDAMQQAAVHPPQFEASLADKRLQLGITDHDHDDWDEIDNWDEILTVPTNPTPTAANRTTALDETSQRGVSFKLQPAVGLRPGGRVKR